MVELGKDCIVVSLIHAYLRQAKRPRSLGPKEAWVNTLFAVVCPLRRGFRYLDHSTDQDYYILQVDAMLYSKELISKILHLLGIVCSNDLTVQDLILGEVLIMELGIRAFLFYSFTRP